MKSTFTIALLLLNFFSIGLLAQIPFVYNKENTGAACTKPPLPAIDQLPVIEPLPDPFIFNTPGKGRSTSFSDWECRRNEIKAQIENYEIGMKPDRPETITATYTPNANPATGVLRVIVTVNGQSLTLTSNVSLPTGSGPFPAVIGMNSPSGSIPADIFTSRNIARITFSHNNVTTYGNPQNTDPFYRLYPAQNVDNTGQYAAWSWGVSRLIDGLELVQSTLPIDLKHIAVTGCSYAGKMALFAGAFDERIALTIAQESGGGGAPSWRVSHNIEPNGSVEKIDNTDYNWFKNDMRLFSADNVYKLPEDHHSLMAMVAPRALLVTGNTDFVWLSNKSAYVSARAAKEAYKTLGISDRMGFYIDGGHGHCAVPTSQRPAISAFVDKFLLDKANVITDTVTVNPFPDLDYKRWYKWWGTGNPVLPPPPPEPVGIRIWMEAECATVGSNWQTLTDADASNGKYVVVNGLNSTATAPAGANAAVTFTFTIDSAAPYNLYARLNCPTANDDSYWIKVDNGPFTTYNNLTTTGWQWIRLITGANLSLGGHTVTIAYREDGAKLDKILLTTTLPNLTAKGTEGSNCGAPPVITGGQVFYVSEKAANNFNLGRVMATDPDQGTEFHRWQITGGSGASAFAINPETGDLTVLDNSSFDFGSSGKSFDLTLTVTDGYFKSAVTTVTVQLTECIIHLTSAAPTKSFPDTIPIDGGMLLLKGIYNGHAYYESDKDAYNWSKSISISRSLGGHLVTITSAEENWFIYNNIPQPDNSDGAWIGLRSTGTPGRFVWVTGEPLSYTNWNPTGEPNNQGGSSSFVAEQFVHLYGWDRLDRWNDIADRNLRFIVEFDSPLLTHKQISGPVNDEKLYPGTYTACYETFNRMDNSRDTSCFTVWAICNPIPSPCPKDTVIMADPATCTATISWKEPKAWFADTLSTYHGLVGNKGKLVLKGIYNGHAYYESTDQYLWTQSRDIATTLGGHLVTIGNAGENDFIRMNIPQADNSDGAWIGLYNTGMPGSFAWVTGEPVSYTNWNPTGEPNNQGGSATFIAEPYVHLYGWDMLDRWNDVGSIYLKFIAEFETLPYTFRQISGPMNGSTQQPGVYTICYERTNTVNQMKDTCCFTVTVSCNNNSNIVIGERRINTEPVNPNLVKGFKVTAAPNPTTNTFTLNIESDNKVDRVNVRVMDLYGRLLEVKNGLASNSVIRFGGNYTPGIYFAQVIQGNKKLVIRLIKE